MTGTARLRWSEPSRALPLHWGTYTDRYLAGLLLIVSGGVTIQGSNSNFGLLIPFGLAAHVIGWGILPTPGWRRACAVFPGLAGIVLIGAGPSFIVFLSLPYAGWLLARSRPLVSWLTLLPVITAGILLSQAFREYRWMLAAMGIMFAVMVGSAWLSRTAAKSWHTR